MWRGRRRRATGRERSQDKDIEKGDKPITGHSSDHKDLPPIAIGEPPEKGLNEKLTYGKTGNDKAELEVRGPLFGHIDWKEREDEPQTHDDNRSRQGDQDQFSPKNRVHKEKS